MKFSLLQRIKVLVIKTAIVYLFKVFEVYSFKGVLNAHFHLFLHLLKQKKGQIICKVSKDLYFVESIG